MRELHRMWRYLLPAAAAVALFVLAIRAHEEGSSPPEARQDASVTPHETPVLHAQRDAGGVEVTVQQRLAHSVSRARLVYDLDGSEHTVDETTECRRLLESRSQPAPGGYGCEITLKGRIPPRAGDLRLVLEDETGTVVFDLDLE